MMTPREARADTYHIMGHIYKSPASPPIKFLKCGQVKLFNESMEELDAMCISWGGNYMYQFAVEPGTYYVQAFGVRPPASPEPGITNRSPAVEVEVTSSNVTQHLYATIDDEENDPCDCY